MDLKKYYKDWNQFTGSLRKLCSTKRPLPDDQLADILHNALSKAKSLALGELISLLEHESSKADDRLRTALEKRRENLL